MRKIAILFTSLAATPVAVPLATPALALELKTYVSATGIGSACTLAAPCAEFQTAHDATFAGGEINCLNSGPFNFGLTITKTITIDCAGTAASTNVMSVNGTGIIVTIRNLSFIAPFNNDAGIDFLNGSALHIENCIFQYYNLARPYGVFFRPSAQLSKLVVTNTTFRNSGSGSVGAGILIKPQSGGSAQVHLERVTAAKNVFGIVADGTGSTAGINMTVSDSVSSGNSQDGIIAVTPAGGAPIGVLVTNTKSTNNAIGIRSIGPNVTVRVKNSDIAGNGTGLSFGSGGALLTFGNNAVQANGSNGAFSGSVGLQ